MDMGLGGGLDFDGKDQITGVHETRDGNPGEIR